MTQLCQSVIVKMHSVTGPRSGWPCTLSASAVLCGMHLCAHHDRYWRHRLARGEKVRIHPERTLPVDPYSPIVDTLLCARCGQAKPLDEFRPLSGGRSGRYSACRQCERDYALATKRRRSGASNKPAASPAAEDRADPPADAPPVEDPVEDPDDEPPGPPVHYEWLAELHCLACERFVSKVVIAYPSAPVIIPERLRCSACGGRPILSGEIERRALGNPFANEPAPIHRVRSVRALT